MSDFEAAIRWRSTPSFIAYGVWDRGALEALESSVVRDLRSVLPSATISSFVATDDDWTCEIGVFDIEMEPYPRDVEVVCLRAVESVCGAGGSPGWMMFEGMLNDVADLLCGAWAPSIYALGTRAV